MFALLFNRHSWVWRGVEGLGLLLAAYALSASFRGAFPWWSDLLLGVIVATHLFLRICAWIRWYDSADRFAGIRLQMWKAVIASSYILCVSIGLFEATMSSIPLIVALVPLGILVKFNIVLIAYHLQDPDTTPVNFYSSGTFKRTS